MGGGGEGLTNLDVDLNVMLLTPVKPRSCMGINTAETDGASDCPASIRPRGVTVSTLDSESSDRGSNPREAFWIHIKLFDELAICMIRSSSICLRI